MLATLGKIIRMINKQWNTKSDNTVVNILSAKYQRKHVIDNKNVHNETFC